MFRQQKKHPFRFRYTDRFEKGWMFLCLKDFSHKLTNLSPNAPPSLVE